jgi:hypothetical protein
MALIQVPPVQAGGMTSLASGSIAASSTGFDLQNISSDYNELWLYITNYSMSETAHIQCRINNNTSSDYSHVYNAWSTSMTTAQGNTLIPMANSVNATQVGQSAWIRFPNYKNTTGYKQYQWAATNADNTLWCGNGFNRSTSAISRITIICSAGTYDSGTYQLFGVK